MITMRCKKGHYTDHFLFENGTMYCPVCGSKTDVCEQQIKSDKPKWKKRKELKNILDPISWELF
jgi:uncharacterized Zn finger protein (UPF0148 family)